MPEHGRKIATILAADVVGYSRLMSVDDEATLAALNVRRAIFDRLVRDFGGREFGSVGDSLMAEYPSAVNAVRCAQAIQQAVNKENEPLPADRRMALRIGVNLGDVIAENAGLFGDGVNVAARLQSLAAPGGILISGAVYEQVKSRVPATFNAAGVRQVKNIPDAIATYEVLDARARSHLDWRRSPRWLRYALAITISAVSAGAIWWAWDGYIASRWPTTIDEGGTAGKQASIAVLPFVDMSPAKDSEYFSDGMSEELLNLLTKIPDLRVAARTSAFKFKGEKVNVQDVARKLRVAHVLEGSVRKSGNKVRITAQLVKAADGYHVWSQTYDRTLDDIFVVQDEIAAAVVKALQVTLLGTALATRSKPQDPEAYNLALQGRYFLDRRGKEDIERSIDYFRQSRERDPGYAPAWVGLSRAYAYQADTGFVPAVEGYRRAREAAEKALALDPQLVDAHLAMGWIHMTYDWDWAAADASYRRALELEPGNARVLRAFIVPAMTFGRWDEAIDATNKGIERDPLRPNYYHGLGFILAALNRDTEAESAFRKALALDPGGAGRHVWIGRVLLLQGKTEAALRQIQQEKDEFWRLSGLSLAYHALGRRSESEAALAALKSKYGGEMAYQIAETHAFRGEADLAFEWLERAYDQRDGGVSDIKGDPMFRKLIDDPRYKAFLKKMKLPE